jgi:hypothetical protein
MLAGSPGQRTTGPRRSTREARVPSKAFAGISCSPSAAATVSSSSPDHPLSLQDIHHSLCSIRSGTAALNWFPGTGTTELGAAIPPAPRGQFVTHSDRQHLRCTRFRQHLAHRAPDNHEPLPCGLRLARLGLTIAAAQRAHTPATYEPSITCVQRRPLLSLTADTEDWIP